MDSNSTSVSAYMSESSEHYQVPSDELRQSLRISGKPLSYWQEKFRLSPERLDLNPATCRMVQAKLLELYQDASFYHLEAQARLTAVKAVGDRAFQEKFNTLVDEFRQGGSRLPAVGTIENIARGQMKGLVSAQTLAEIELRFWKDILADLDYYRKLVESASFNNNAEMRFVSHG